MASNPQVTITNQLPEIQKRGKREEREESKDEKNER